ncbi:MutS protein msh4 [Mortierella antarctica]|nr:MutS protein msh4 [Mortierella antarctica]
MNLYEPVEILVPTTAVEPTLSKLVKIIKESVPASTITPVARRYFNDSAGMDYITRYIIKENSSSLLLGIAEKYFCLAATAAVLRYIEESRNATFLNHSVKFMYGRCSGSMIIDPATARNLELTINLSSQNDKETFFGILNQTVTPMGSRVLRSNILQPCTSKKTINTRLDCVQELSQEEEMFFELKRSLKAFHDVDYLITSFIQVPSKPTIKHSEQMINHIINLKHTLRTFAGVAQALVGGQNTLLRSTHKALTDPRLAKLSGLIDDVIEQNVVLEKTAVGLRNQRCFAVKAGCNGLLDVARQTYKETINDIFELVNRYVEEYDVKLKVQFNVTMGYYLSTTVDQLNGAELPLIFINIVRKAKLLSFTTLELIKKNAKINDSLTEVYLMSDKIVGDLSSEVRAEVGALYKASECIALLDMLLSFAHQCTVNEYVRPEFTDTLVIKQGRHPVIEKLYSTPFVPNDTYASSAKTFQVITGPNMSGKSTYLRQVALLTIMAQIGSFVPAEYASIRVMDQLVSRICNDDSLELNASTFMVEMRETAYILQNVTEKSLVVIDELGRELTSSLRVYHNVVNLHLETELARDMSNKPGIVYKYHLTDGSAKEEHYGLALAKTMHVLDEVTRRAEEVSLTLESLQANGRRKSESSKVVVRRRALAQITYELVLLAKLWEKGSRSRQELVLALRGVQQHAVETMLSIDRLPEDDLC